MNDPFTPMSHTNTLPTLRSVSGETAPHPPASSVPPRLRMMPSTGAPADATAGPPARTHVLSAEDLCRSLPRMRARARSLASSPEDAEDLVQDTLLYVLRRPRMLAQEDATGYLLRAVRNMWISQHRRKRVQWVEPLDEHHDDIAGSSPDPADIVEDQLAWSTVKALPARYRDTVVAVVLCGLSYREAAESLDVPIGTIMSRLYRARRLLEPVLREAA